MTLTEFLTARKTEETENRIISDAAWDAVQARLSPSQALDYMNAYDKTIRAQAARLDRALCNLGWAMRAALAPRDAKREAVRYANHPDFRDEWRP